jgi:hypothetical protein
MAHVREQIISAIATALAGLTTTGSSVFPSRVDNLQASEVPGLTIYDTDEIVDEEGSTQAAQLRIVTIAVVGHVASTSGDGVSDVLNTIASEVETAIYTDITLGGIALGLTLESTTKEYDNEGDQVAGRITLSVNVQYMTALGVPDIPVT